MKTYFDNTRIKDFKTCPRAFYYRHRRHWRREGTAPALVFGLAWHAAMDILWPKAKELNDEDLLTASFLAFDKVWRDEGFPGYEEWKLEYDETFQPRTPGNAIEMLAHYIKQRGPFIRESATVEQVEMPFAVPIYDDNPDTFYIGRIDKVIVYKGRWIAIEHKTSTSYSKEHIFRSNFINSFAPNSQIDGYAYNLPEVLGKKLQAIWIDAALVHKTVHDGFKFLPIDRSEEMLSSWHVETQNWIERIDMEDKLSKAEITSGKPGPMKAFPKNTEACQNFSGCSYADICRFIPDPRKLENPPDGFIKDRWSPFERLGIKELGLEDEI